MIHKAVEISVHFVLQKVGVVVDFRDKCRAASLVVEVELRDFLSV